MTARAVLFDADGTDRDIDLAGDDRPKLGEKQLLWIDVDDREPEDLRLVAELIGLEAEALDRLAQEDRQTRILRLQDRVVLTVGAVEPDDAQARRREVDIVVGPNHVVTVHDGVLTPIDDFRKEVRHEPDLGRLDAVAFAAGVLDSILTAYFRQIEAIEREIDRLDEIAVRRGGDGSFLAAMLVIRRRIALLRRALAPNREALVPLERPDFGLRSDLGVLWPGLLQRLERAIDGVENARELLVGSFDLYLGQASQRTNDVMKTLTIISAVALPAIVLAGVMGMNFKPSFFDAPGNFFVVVGVMVLLSVVILLFARWRAWI